MLILIMTWDLEPRYLHHNSWFDFPKDHGRSSIWNPTDLKMATLPSSQRFNILSSFSCSLYASTLRSSLSYLVSFKSDFQFVVVSVVVQLLSHV